MNPFLNSAYFLFCVGQDVNLLQLEDISDHRSPSQTRVRHPPFAMPLPLTLFCSKSALPLRYTPSKKFFYGLWAPVWTEGQGREGGGLFRVQKGGGGKAAQRKLCTPRILRIFFLLAPECQRLYLFTHLLPLSLYFCFRQERKEKFSGSKGVAGAAGQ